MLETSLSPLSFAAGTAILTNACAIMQNGTTTRYSLAVAQWRELRTVQAAGDGGLAREYMDADAALGLAEYRVRLQLRGLSLINGAVALFAAITVACLAGAGLARMSDLVAASLDVAVTLATGIALLLLLSSVLAFFREGTCGRALLALHRQPSLRRPSPHMP